MRNEKIKTELLSIYLLIYADYAVYPSSATADLPTEDLPATQFKTLTMTPPICNRPASEQVILHHWRHSRQASCICTLMLAHIDDATDLRMEGLW